MAKKKVYGVRFSLTDTAIFEDWDICKEQILGKKGVQYKGFSTMEEALAFIEGDEGTKEPRTKLKKKDLQPQGQPKNLETEIAIYVDGSYRDSTYSYGFVVIDQATEQVLHKQAGRGVDPEAALLRNVSGEMKGAMEAVSYCLRAGIMVLTICYDYNGIEKWATGKWKRNNIYTQQYHQFMQGKMKILDIHFSKIKGHSGDAWNDLADQLAKEGLEH